MKKTYLLFLLIGLLFLGCKKEKSDKPLSNTEIISLLMGNSDGSSSYPDNYIILRSTKTMNLVDTAGSYNINVFGEFKDIGQKQNVGNLLVNSRIVSPDCKFFLLVQI